MRPFSTVVLSFALGACSTVAVQSAASVATEEPEPPAAQPWMPAISPVLVRAEKAERRHPPGNPDVRVTILARGQEAFLGRLQMPAGAKVPLHRDATEEYIHVLEGGGTITVDGTAHEIAPGDTVYMPADAEVSFANGSVPLVGLQVFAGPEPAAKYGAWELE